MAVISMLTDFGLKDGNVGVMKGVILSIAPTAQIIDISHTINPQDVNEAALVLLRSVPYFPQDTVHMVVVDPGVGTDRWPIAARLGTQYFVGPDNGVITMLLEATEQRGFPTQFIHLNNPNYWLPEVSYVFHGRDIFAPAAAHLAAGVPLEKLGTDIPGPKRLKFPKPQKTEHGWRGEVIHIDHFGNISSNIRIEHLGQGKNLDVYIGGEHIEGLVQTFGERSIGDLVALYGSTGNLIVSLVNGSAAEMLGTVVGDPVEVLVKGN